MTATGESHVGEPWATSIPLHPFAARMAPSIAFAALRGHQGPLRVLDPMVGSGTTVIAARMCGHYGMGFDLDPLAVLISRTNCSTVDPDSLLAAAERVAYRAQERAKALPVSKAYPHKADEETKAYIRFWFDKANRRQLAALVNAIKLLRVEPEIKDALWVILSGTIVTKKVGVSLAADVSHSRPHRVYQRAPARAVEAFLRRARKVALVLQRQPKANDLFPVAVQRADARHLPIPDECIDVVVTSPPYVNAIDYLRGHKLSLVWMGYSLSQVRAIEHRSRELNYDDVVGEVSLLAIGVSEETQVATSVLKLVKRYVFNMLSVIREIGRVLVPGGKAIFVLGNPTIKEQLIDTTIIFETLGSRCGLILSGKKGRLIPENRRYLPPPSYVSTHSPLRKRLSEETIITFRKSEAATRTVGP